MGYWKIIMRNGVRRDAATAVAILRVGIKQRLHHTRSQNVGTSHGQTLRTLPHGGLGIRRRAPTREQRNGNARKVQPLTHP